MDAIKYLRHQHSGFRKTLKQIKALKDENKKIKKFESFTKELTTHEKMEQTVWYPVLRKDPELRDIIKHLLSEEKGAEKAIKKLKATEYGLIWKLRFYKFGRDVDHHAKEEEQELFPKVRKKLSKTQLNALGIKMRKFTANSKSKTR